MSTRVYDKGRQAFLDAAIDWNTDTIKAMLMDLSVVDTAVKAITGATNATPIVITSNAHGFSNGDICVQRDIGGCLSANQTAKIANVTTNTYELTTTTPEALNVVGSGAYTSGGKVINLTLAQNLSDVDATLIGTAVALATPTIVNGVAGAADPTFTAVPNGTTSHALSTYKDTGTPSTSRLASFHDGKHQVIVAGAAATSATTIIVEPLDAGIPSGTALVFSNGVTGTLTAPAAQFARTLTVSALAAGIAVGHTADAPSTANPNFPISGNGGNITVNVDTAVNKLFKL